MTSTTMKCINCYREINDNLKFCSFCGAKQPADREGYEREHPELATARSEEAMALIAQHRKVESKLRNEISEYETLVKQLKNEKRKSIIIGAVAVAASVLALVMWFKVFNPSEVTNKAMTEFNYYGPMNDGKPNGLGVAVYHDGDKDGRRFYFGNFDDGERHDDKAILFYNDGTYFYGKMEGDNWVDGSFYNAADSTVFMGTFKDNSPDNGKWFGHKFLQEVKDGN